MNDRARHAIVVPMLSALVAVVCGGCDQQMSNMPRYKPLAASDFFADGQASRPRVPGTIARGSVLDPELVTGRANGVLVSQFPMPVTRELLGRGQQRFDIFCSPCHGRVGSGDGMVVLRGFRPPASFHIERLREAPAGHFVDVMANGVGEMSSYAARVAPADRWAIAAYIRALQRSQLASLADVPPNLVSQLNEGRQ